MATAPEDFIGYYSIDRHTPNCDYGDEWLATVGVNYIKRKMVCALSVDYEFLLKDNIFTEKVYTTFVNKFLDFELGGKETEYFDDAMGYTLFKATTYNDGKMVSEIREKHGKFTIHEERSLSADKQTLCSNTVLKMNDKSNKTVTLIRYWHRKK